MNHHESWHDELMLSRFLRAVAKKNANLGAIFCDQKTLHQKMCSAMGSSLAVFESSSKNPGPNGGPPGADGAKPALNLKGVQGDGGSPTFPYTILHCFFLSVFPDDWLVFSRVLQEGYGGPLPQRTHSFAPEKECVKPHPQASFLKGGQPHEISPRCKLSGHGPISFKQWPRHGYGGGNGKRNRRL